MLWLRQRPPALPSARRWVDVEVQETGLVMDFLGDKVRPGTTIPLSPITSEAGHGVLVRLPRLYWSL